MKKIPFFLRLLAALTPAFCQPGLASTALWLGSPGTSATTNWSDTANWSNALGPNGNDTVFGDTGASGVAGTINSVVNNSSLNPLSLTFTNGYIGPSRYHTVLIPAGIGMTNANALTVGINSFGPNYPTTVNFIGAGTFAQNGLSLTVKNVTSTGTSGVLATLDLSGLSNFVYKASSGTLAVGGSGSDNRGSGQFNLAGGSNTLTVGTISIATGTGTNGLGGTLNLGTGTNILNVSTLNVGAGRSNNGILQFLGATGGLRLRGVGGTDSDRVSIVVANRNNSANGNVGGTIDFTGGHPVDIKAATITLGQATTGNPTTGQGNGGILEFDTGTINANTINLAINSLANVSTTGELDVGANGTLVINGALSMGNQTAGNATGFLNINGGAVQIFGNITKANVSSSTTLMMTGGTLNMAGLTNTIGTTAIPIDSLVVNNSTLTLPVINGKPSAVVTYLLFGGFSDTINISAVPGGHILPAEFPVINYNQIVGNFDFQLGTIAGGYDGYLTNDTALSTVALVLTSAPTPIPVITNLLVSGINLQFMGNNGSASQPFYLLASTNAALPPLNWLNLATYNFDANGNFNFTIPARTNAFRCFRLQVP